MVSSFVFPIHTIRIPVVSKTERAKYEYKAGKVIDRLESERPRCPHIVDDKDK